MISHFLLDKEFLRQVDEYYQREVYVKLVSLDINENPIAEIQGCAVSGSISVNGASAVRRTCNLSLLTSSIDINEMDWVLKTKFRVFVGLKNYINTNKYEDILWFKQGTFVLTSFSSQLNSQGYTISVSGKDKMCLLNGELGGNLTASTDFGTIEITSQGITTIEHIPIVTIIREALHMYAHEPYENIIINDLDTCGVELLEYCVSDNEMYIVRPTGDNSIDALQMYFESNQTIGSFIKQNDLNDGAIFNYEGMDYELVKRIRYGDTAGYRLTDITYAGDLIIAIGGSLTSMLDKIVKQLGEFEYFYDIDGRFNFGRKKIYHNVSWTNTINTGNKEKYDASLAESSQFIYEFNSNILIESFQNKPNISGIKNDYSIWGKRGEVPVSLRYAIDHKPGGYYSHRQQKVYLSTQYGGTYDWRELIYQMAMDYRALQGKIEQEREENVSEGLRAFKEYAIQNEINLSELQFLELEDSYLNAWNSGYSPYYTDLEGFWRQLYDPNKEAWVENKHWNPDLIDGKNLNIQIINPELLPYWLDFIDDTSEIGKYSVQEIGRRTKVVNDNEVKSIFFRETPNVLFVNQVDNEYDLNEISYTIFNLPSMFTSYFQMSAQGKSAKDTLDSLLYQGTYYQESITVSAIPIYYLEPNTRIKIYDNKSGIDGDYIIKSFNLSLAHDGMMSITATKASERII